MTDIAVTRTKEVIAADADTVAQLLEEGYEHEVEDVKGKTAEVLLRGDSLAS